MPDSNLPLTVLTSRRKQLEDEIKSHQEKHEAERKALLADLAVVNEAISLQAAGLDMDMVRLARAVLYLSGSYADGGSSRAAVVRDAINWLSTGKGAYQGLDVHFYGTKNYDAWRGQRSDHPYGWGPSHGYTCFAVGLRKPKVPLMDTEREAAIYYLVNIERIEQAQKAARAA